jgi:hypothetical protein
MAALPVPEHVFALVTNFSSSFIEGAQQPIDGIVGMASETVSASRSPTLLDALFAAHPTLSRRFAFEYNAAANETTGSTLYLGATPPRLTPRGVHWLPSYLRTAGMWYVDLQDVRVQGVADDDDGAAAAVKTQEGILLGARNVKPRGLGMCGSKSRCVALIDTGSSFLAVPSVVFEGMMGEVLKHREDCRFVGT